jgi:predicted lipoprotein
MDHVIERSRKALLALLLVGALPTCGGGGSGASTPADTFDRRAMLASQGEHVILPALRAFTAAADALETATAAYAAAVGGEAGSEELAGARDAWRQAMDVWQRAELFQLGPAGSPTMMMGGEGQRDRIYSWPTVNTCTVDQGVAGESYATPGFFDTALVTAYGLDALEYLLFNESQAHTCPAQHSVNGPWAALTDAERTRRRADYAAAAAVHLAARAQALLAEWEPAEGNFLGQLSTAGQSGSIYPTAQSAVDDLFAALYYAELRVKDRKLAVPAGISPLCPTTTCPQAFESRWARHSGQNVVTNLRAFRALFVGNAEGEEARPGFDDFLEDRGASALAETIVADTDAAIAAVEALEGGLEAALEADPATVSAVHAAVKKVTDSVKSQMVTVLNLAVPSEGAGDND